MAVLPIRLFPDPILRKGAKPVLLEEPNLGNFLRDLTETLSAQPGGIGIAAPQVGRAKRIVVVDVSPKDVSKGLRIMINPVIRYAEGVVWTREGCMSLPDYTANVKRAARISIEWINELGERQRTVTDGIEAICLQHEMDHLNGLLFVDRVASLKTDLFPRRRRV